MCKPHSILSMNIYERFIDILILLFDIIIAIVIYSLHLPFNVNNLSNAMSFLCQEFSTLFFSHARERNKYKFNANKNKNAEKTAMIHFQSFSPPVATSATLHALDGIVLLPLPPRAF